MNEPSDQKSKTNPFTLVEAVSYTKADIFEENQDQYVPFLINRALSYHPDAVLYANEMNLRAVQIPKKAQFHYLLQTLRPRKRFSKWAKPAQDDVLDMIKDYYDYNDIKARAALKILTQEQIEEIRVARDTGGEVGKKSRKAKGT